MIDRQQLEDAMRAELPGLARAEIEHDVVTRAVTLRLEVQGLGAAGGLTDEALARPDAVPHLLRQLVRRLRDDATRAYGLGHLVDEIREQAKRDVADARIILLAELRAALAFQIRDPEAQRIVAAAFDKAAENG